MSGTTARSSDERLDVSFLGASDRRAAGEAWQALERRVADAPLAVGWDWTETWVEHFGDVVPHRFAIVSADDDVIGAALIAHDERSRGPVRLRQAHLGTAGGAGGSVYVQRNGLLAATGRTGAVAQAILRHATELGRVDALVLDGFLEEAAAPFLERSRWRVGRETCFVADLCAAPEGDVQRLFTRGVRRHMRRSEQALGPFEVEWATDEATAQAVLRELVDLHQRRWQSLGHPGAFAAPRVRDFHRAIVTRLLPDQRVVLVRVTGPGGIVGCRYAFAEGSRVSGYQGGWAAHGGRRASPGLATHLLSMQAAHDRGFRYWDHLSGMSEHKQRLSTTTYELVWATERRAAVRWAMFDAARAARGSSRVVRRRMRSRGRAAPTALSP